MKRWAGILITGWLLTTITHADIIHVDDDAPPAGDGLSWSTAFRYLQDALAIAQPNDEIRLAQGTYQPDLSENGHATPGFPLETFQLFDGALIRGGYRGCPAGDCNTGNPDERDLDQYFTVLTGDLLNDDGPDFTNRDDNSLHVVRAVGLDLTATLDGCYIRGGNAIFSSPHDAGGGLRCDDSSLIAQNCIFTNNQAIYSAGADVSCGIIDPPPGPRDAPAVRFLNCAFHHNRCRPVDGRAGAALSVWDTACEAVNCEFTQNTGQTGGAIRLGLNAQLKLDDCLLAENTADDQGAAIFTESGSNARLAVINCQLYDNTAGQLGGAFFGQMCVAMFCNCAFANNSANYVSAIFTQRDLTLMNCLIHDHTASSEYVLYTTHAHIHNCVFANNSATQTIVNLGVNSDLANSILWDNATTPLSVSDPDSVTVRHCVIQGGWDGDHILDTDPRFVAPEVGAYNLQPDSPCIDAGTNLEPARDIVDLDADGCKTDFILFDLSPRARYQDDPATPDTGTGAAPIIDIGAYEFGELAENPTGPCHADSDCDGSLTFADIMYFVAAFSGHDGWAAYYADQHGGEQPPCPYLNNDCDNSGAVTFEDIPSFVNLIAG